MLISLVVLSNIAARLTGSAGLGGSDAHALSLAAPFWRSQRLRLLWPIWDVVNKSPPWAAIRALMQVDLLINVRVFDQSE
jgi:hypothetical protein